MLRRSLPERFTSTELDAVLDTLHPRPLTRPTAYRTIEQIRWIAACNYVSEFPPDSGLSERVL